MPDPVEIPASHADLLTGAHIASVATIQPDGSPQVSATWVDLQDGLVLVPVKRTLQKTRNLRRDPRVSVLVVDRDDPGRFVEVRGTAELIDDPGSTLTARLWPRYEGEPWPADDQGSQRLQCRISPTRVRTS